MWNDEDDQRIVQKLKTKGFLMRCAGWLLAPDCGITTIAGSVVKNNFEYVIYDLLALALTVGGVILIVRGIKMKKIADLYPVYAIHLTQNPSGTITEAAALIDEDEDIFGKTVYAMQRYGLLKELVLVVEHYHMERDASAPDPN